MGTLIRNGFIYDGNGNPPFKGDVLIHGEKIVKVGVIEKRRVRKTIDASNAVLAPGFIDIGGSLNLDLDIFSSDCEENYVRQGITTVIGGNGGFSLAPLSRNSLDLIDELKIRGGININWNSVKELFSTVKRFGLMINFGTLVGHSNLRNIVYRGEPRDLTDNEIDFLKRILSQALNDGACGLSFLPLSGSQNIFNHEMRALAEVLALKGRLFCIEAGNILNSADVMEKALNFTSKLNLNLELNGLDSLKNLKESYETANINFGYAPFNYKILKRPNFLSENVQGKISDEFMLAPNSIVSSGGASALPFTTLAETPFLKFIRLAKDFKNFTLEKAVSKITSLPAKKYGIKKRGLIKENYKADINVLRDGTPSEVLVNGRLVLDGGEIQKIKSGAIITPAFF